MKINLVFKSIFSFLLIIFVFITPVLAFAQDTDGNLSGNGGDFTKVKNPIPAITSIPEFIKTILEFVIKIGIPIVALAIIYSGFLFVSARGKPSELETAKRSIMYTLIGAAILLGAWAIAIMISETVLDLGKTSFIIINNSIS